LRVGEIGDTHSKKLQDAETYEHMAELAEYAESIQNIRQALSEEGRPLNQFTREFEVKHGIKR